MQRLDSLLLGGGGGLLLGLLLESALGETSRVQREIAAINISNWLDFSLTDEVSQESSGDGTINLELFHDGGASDAENLGHLGADLLKSLLVEEDFVVELVLNLGLGPGLLLGLGSLSLVGLGALRGASSFIFSRLLCFSLHSHKHISLATPQIRRYGRGFTPTTTSKTNEHYLPSLLL